jgi:hypothetical protein
MPCPWPKKLLLIVGLGPEVAVAVAVAVAVEGSALYSYLQASTAVMLCRAVSHGNSTSSLSG